jgi:hypothetical protein
LKNGTLKKIQKYFLRDSVTKNACQIGIQAFRIELIDMK